MSLERRPQKREKQEGPRQEKPRNFGLKEALLAAGVAIGGIVVFPPASHAETPAYKAVEKLWDEISPKDFHSGMAYTVQLASEKPYEILTVYAEPANEEKDGAWIDFRGGGLKDVFPPDIGPKTKLWRSLARYSQGLNNQTVRLCMSHTHTDDYLKWLKKGRLPYKDLKMLKEIEIIKIVDQSEDPRGYTDIFDERGPFATPPGVLDVKSSGPYERALKEFAKDSGVTLELYEVVANEIGLWYWKNISGGEQESGAREEIGDNHAFARLQAQWALFVNKLYVEKGEENVTPEDILEHPEHQAVIDGYAELGVRARFVPKEHIPHLKNCAAGFDEEGTD